MTKLELVTEKKQKEVALKHEEESWKLTRKELARRVHQLRGELEAAKERYDGALFDNFTDGIPRTLDADERNREPYGAVEFLSPGLKGRTERLQKENPLSCISDDASELFFFSTEVAYQIGMLAGAIYADCSKATVDRFERGLVVSLFACHWIGKK
jgi:hypothetical protein